MRNVPQPSPTLLQQRVGRFGHQIELFEIDRLPRNHRILFQRWLALFARLVYRHVDFFELTASGVIHHLRPGFVGLAQSHGIGVARSAVAAQSLIGQFGDVRSAHHDFHPGGPDRVGNAVGLRDHARHGADAD